MSEVTVRTATIADAHAIATVRVRTWRAAYHGLIDQVVLDALDIDREAQRRRDRWDANHADPRGAELVATIEGEVVGWAAYGPVEVEHDPGVPALPGRASSRGQLFALYALPEHWSRGIGHALIGEVERRMRALGVTDAHLWVLEGNERAEAFYERHGWVEDGARKDDDRLVAGAAVRPLRERRRIRRLAR